MCDTFLAAPDSTASGAMLFGKNSDRQRNESQAIELLPAAEFAPGESVRTTYLTIPQVRRTHAVLLSRPYWLWGAEIGANEHGVVIGNEGLSARTAASRDPALTGMDLIRLGLERASTAAEAVEIMTSLLERHDQGGNCGHLEPSYYHNGFLVADARDAFVLETVGREWITERVSGVRAISNEYSIGTDVDRCSTGIPDLLRQLGWAGEGAAEHAAIIKDPARSHIGSARERAARSTALLSDGRGHLGIADVTRILRDHAGRSGADWNPAEQTAFSLCVHGGTGQRIAQTAGSMASEIRARDSVHWVTATSTPCIGLFKPVLFGTALPDQGPKLSGRYDPETVWWRHERLNRRAVVGDYSAVVSAIAAERDALEEDFRARVADVLDGGNAADRDRVVASCWADAAATEDRWSAELGEGVSVAGDPYHDAWAELNSIAGLVESDAVASAVPLATR